MKRLLMLICVALCANCSLWAQAPQSVPYQAVARDASGNLLVNQNVSLRFTVHQSSGSGTTQYQETQSATTNKLGLFSVNVGSGTVVSGTFAGITWSDGQPKYIQVEIDPAGGTSYTSMGATQMMSVPYALYAGSATSVPSANLTESTSDVLSITGGGNSVVNASGTTIQVKKATASQDGYLSSADWSTFNAKQAALTFNLPLANTSNTVTCTTCATTTNGGALSGTPPIAISSAGAISCASCVTTATLSGFANPTASIGMTASNGSATTAMRSDAAPAINAAITPTWTGTHTFSNSSYSALFTGGNVGIGGTTPSYPLDIKVASTIAELRLYGQAGSGSDNVQLRFAGQKDGETWAIGGDIAAGGATKDFEFYSMPNSATRMAITAAGSVGVGTTGPSGLLELQKTTQLQANLVLSGQEYYQSSNTSTGIALMIGVSRTGNKQLWIADEDNVATPSSSNSVIRLMPNGTTPAIDAIATNGTTVLNLQVGTSGSVGIGGAPSQKLDVYGNAGIRGDLVFENTPTLCSVNNSSYTLSSTDIANGIWYGQNNNWPNPLVLPGSGGGQVQGQIITIYDAASSSITVNFPNVNNGGTGSVSIGSGQGMMFMWTTRGASTGWFPIM